MFLPFHIWASVIAGPVERRSADIIVISEAHRLRMRNKLIRRRRLGY